MFDVIMPVTAQHNAIARLSILSLVRHIAPRRIYALTPRENFPFFETLQKDSPVEPLDENRVIEGITLGAIADYIEQAGQSRVRAGWYFQQFLKMAACFLPGISEHYLIWDADTVMLSPIAFLNESRQALVKPSTEYHAPYFDTYNKILGKTRSVNFSFISEHFMIRTTYMRELISAIQQQAPSQRSWVWAILEAIEKNHLSGAGFSEYETYGNFVHEVHPEAFSLRPLTTLRYGARKFGPAPNGFDLYRLSRSYAYASFESWDAAKPVRVRLEKTLSLLLFTLSGQCFKRK